MSNYATNLKTWGDQGTEFPDGYSYLEGDQPVDAWDNYLTHNQIKDIQHLIDLTNTRMESVKGASHPTSPEVGHISHRTDSPEVGSGEQTYVYDGTNAEFRRLMKADGDTMSGTLNMKGYKIYDSSGELTLEDPVMTGTPESLSARIDHEWFRNHNGGKIASGSIVPVGTFELSDTETISVSQATLTKDGFTTVCVSGVDLRIVPDSASEGSTTGTTAVLSGDGTTLFNDETGSPLASYQNTSGAAQTVIVGLDNGAYGAGYGSSVTGFASYIARTE